MVEGVAGQTAFAVSLVALLLFSCATETRLPPDPEQERAENRAGASAPEAPGSARSLPRFGVFTGLDPENIERLEGYDLAVIDVQYYSRENIIALHDRYIQVYSYLNIGSIEEFRPYYREFEALTLGDYEGWDDERWIDIGAPAWRHYLVRVLAWDLVKKGVDGFFIDNTDIYYHYPERDISDGIMDTLERLGEEYGLPLIINGGDAFMKEALERKALKATTVKRVNQENVFTLPDPRTGRLGKQSAEALTYYQSYLSLCKAAGLEVSLTEYLKGDAALRQQILDYCDRNGFAVFIAESLALDRGSR
jgi:hypothetical protein